ENSANGTVVGTVTGVDPDSWATLTYTLTNNAGGRFAIDQATGVLTVANGTLLDYESATSHDITVRVTNQAGFVLDKTLTINVTNVNDPPTFANFPALRNFAAGHTVTIAPQASFSDADIPTLANVTVAVTGGTFAGDGDVLAATTTGTNITA